MKVPRVKQAMPWAVLLLAQAVWGIAYVAVERRRATGAAPPFRYETLTEGRIAPELAWERPNGQSSSLSALRGRPVFLHFWATWCAPCSAEIPDLIRAGRKVAERGEAAVLLVSLDEDWGAVQRFFGGDPPAEVVRSEAEPARTQFEVSALPDSYLVGRDGKLILRVGGPRSWGEKALGALLDEAKKRELDRR